MAPQILIVADDLTGAADTGACFAARGLATVIPLAGAAIPDADAIVLSTETRDLAGEDATRIVTAAVSRWLTAGGGASPRWIYKKIDSALRGNLHDEVLATMAASGEDRVLVAPAFPAEGRTTVGGRQFVDGLPLADSPFGGGRAQSDVVAVFSREGSPARSLVLPTLRDQPAAIAAILETESSGILVADAATEDDLLALARATSLTSLRLLCGTAGFARALAETLPLHPASSPETVAGRGGGPVLVVAGSQNEATLRQVEAMARMGTPIVRFTRAALDGMESIDGAVREVEAHLAAGKAAVLTTAGLAPSPLGGAAVTARLAEVVVAPGIARAIGGVVLTGGDVAAAVLAALGAAAFRLGGEIAPGQPWGLLQGGTLPGLPVATKAGSFGDDDALLAGVEFLTAGGGRVASE